MQPEQAVAKKKMGIWAWLAIGCVGVVVVGGLVAGGVMFVVAKKAKSIAEDPTAAIGMIAALNPEIEVVDRDAGEGKVTIRNKRSGETVTVDLDDLKEGRFSFTSDEGSTTVDFDQQQGGKLEIRSEGADGGSLSFGGDTKLPGWVPSYPGSTSEGVYSAETAEQSSGTFTLSTRDSVQQVFTYFKGQLEGGGYKVSETRFSGSEGDSGMLVGESADGSRTLTLTISTADGQTQVAGMYSQKKG